ncbi:MAG: 4-alpha-glucanotransferase [Rhodovarius sp.]|nr:4-alpha-glucanotransferase [Rhodovarius sp.]
MIGPWRPGAGRLGVTPLPGGGLAVAIPAPGAEALFFCRFDEEGREHRHRLRERIGDLFCDVIPELGPDTRYGLRAEGAGLDPAKLLIDPWARRLDRPFTLHPALFAPGQDSAPHLPRCLAEPPLPAAEPFLPEGPAVIYELQVRSFTRLHPDIPAELRGTVAGLAHPAAIAHLKALGITHVELMPLAAWIDERHLPALGLTNLWGYNPVALLAPDPRLAPGGMADIRAAVAALAEAGIGTILDVVLNHTGEGDAAGPTLSLRGLGGDRHWYRLAADGALSNDSGCGNALDLAKPWPLRLAMDALRHWAEQTGCAGFRLDLAVTLGRRGAGFDPDAPFLLALRQDPLLRRRIIIAEPWDAGPDGHQLGRFPPGFGEWNDRFRDGLRRLWRGDPASLGEAATRLAGSADIFTGRPASDSINYIAAHDGFTLADFLAYSRRHNHANGEDNRDGNPAEICWNNGEEGPTRNPAIQARRARLARALLICLMAARGSPMLGMGDELGRSQGGNNNAYAQDNPTSWLDWSRADEALIRFTARLIHARRAHPALHAPRHLTGAPDPATGLPDVIWAHPSGRAPDWAADQALLMVLAEGEDRVALALHAGPEDSPAIPLRLPAPRPGHRWVVLADAAEPDRHGPPPDELSPGSALLVAELRRRPGQGPDDATIRARAEAKGIATAWHDLSGRRHLVPIPTLRALIDALPEEAPRILPRHVVGPGEVTLSTAADRLTLHIALEDGGSVEWPVREEEGRRGFTTLSDGRMLPARHLRLPPLPEGVHRLALGEEEAMLIIAPARCHLPARRGFAVMAQTYALRRRGDGGIGDFAALALLAEGARDAGAWLVGISPPHALMPAERARASPYQPSDRRFLEPALIAIEGLPPAPPGDLVDYEAVWQAKRAALLAAFRAAPRRPLPQGALLLFAAHAAISEREGHSDARRWPAGLGHGADTAVAAFIAAHEEAIRFHAFCQELADAQLSALAGLLYRDLAVGAAPDGAEVWSNPGRFLPGFSLGAPPDPLGPEGQVWGLPPPLPQAAPAHFAELLAANMRHAAALRIDHVMGLQRLFVVPAGAPAAAGTYLSYPREAMLALLRLMSQRHRCLVIGEALGTVPPDLPPLLEASDILAYRVLAFEREADGRFRPPRLWPERAAACAATHDTPTLRGWWEGADLEERAALGLLPEGAFAARAADRARLIEALTEAGLIATAPRCYDPALAAAIHRLLAEGAPRLLLVQAEELAGARRAVNLPGTDRERPNWRLRLPVPVEDLFDTPWARAILEAIRAAGR